MKSFSLLLIFAITVACHSEIKKQTPNQNREVYICKSPNARRYHLDKNCQSLKKCSREIIQMNETQAQKIGMSLCGHED